MEKLAKQQMTYKAKNISDISIFYFILLFFSFIFCIISTRFGVRNVTPKGLFKISIFAAPWP